MAALCKHFTYEFNVISRNIFGAVCATSLQRQGVRCLYAASALGVDNYVRTRERVNLQFQNISEKFRVKMKEFTENQSTSAMIFTEDLKNMLHLVDSKPEDLDLILKMMQKFNQQNKNLRFGNFVFGPVVMRMYHHLNQPEAAFNAFMDPQLEGFFDQLMSYQILLDLLLRSNLYDKVLEVFDVIKNKQIEGAKYPKNVVVLVFATLYKMNSSESLQRATQLWSDLQNVGHVPMRRAVAFSAALAINQNAPHIALEMLSSVSRPNYVTIRNLKIAALADLGRPEDTFPLLRSILEADNPQVKLTVAKESIDKVKNALKKSEKQDLQLEFDQLEKRLNAGEHIIDQSQDEWLYVEILAESSNFSRDQRFLAASFNRQRPGGRDLGFGGGRDGETKRRPRPGLAQMN
ncbi:hypothetical protein R5R35_010148 [Gryllus longicercus]|uniref:Pentatricopeptide repeat-containing protein 2, mitochondrial n=1 Tax=Gryllus longicercus TaxID=2509291 RepID=A0AAN9Z0V7_9ORTH